MNNENQELELELQEKERFIDDGSTVNVVLSPQCVDCVYNLGLLDCAKFEEKPHEYISNAEKCPEREAE